LHIKPKQILLPYALIDFHSVPIHRLLPDALQKQVKHLVKLNKKPALNVANGGRTQCFVSKESNGIKSNLYHILLQRGILRLTTCKEQLLLEALRMMLQNGRLTFKMILHSTSSCLHRVTSQFGFKL
jgi:hypothetical protein